jgi:hypothetical protein
LKWEEIVWNPGAGFYPSAKRKISTEQVGHTCDRVADLKQEETIQWPEKELN